MASKIPCIVIEVSGGIAHIIEKPKGVELCIIDHDNEKEEHEYAPERWEGPDVIIKGRVKI